MTSATHDSTSSHKSPPPVSPKEGSKLTELLVAPSLFAGTEHPTPADGSTTRQKRKRLGHPDSPPSSTRKKTRSHAPQSQTTTKSQSSTSTKVTDQRRSDQKPSTSTTANTSSDKSKAQTSERQSRRDNSGAPSEEDTSSDDPTGASDKTCISAVDSATKKKKEQMGNCIQSRPKRRGEKETNDQNDPNSPQAYLKDGDQTNGAGQSSSPHHQAGDISSGDDKEQHLEQRSRRRLSLIHADPITHQSHEGPRGTTQVVKPGGSRREKLSLNSLLTQNNQEGRRVSVMGAAAHRQQGNFENKDETCRGNVAIDSLQEMGIGHACKKGLKPESPNQDDFFIYRVDDIGLYGIFDGHGPYGHDISNYVQSNLCQYLWNHDMFDTDKRQALEAAFAKTQSDIEALCERREFDASLSGCTATVIIHDVNDNKLFTAHLGDSRAVMARRNPDSGAIEAIDLTEDHKPTLDRERSRIEAHGGEVKRLEGDIPHRVFLKDKLYPGLAMSRAFGDLVATQAGVTSEPEINEVDIDPKADLFIVLCSDGVWEFISSQEAVQMVSQHDRNTVQAAADQLARESWNKWIVEEGDVVDDITVEIIYL